MAENVISHLPPIQGGGGIGGIGTGGGITTAAQAANAALDKITFNFNVTPTSLQQAGSVNVTWSYTLPVGTGYTFTVELDGETVAASGSKNILVSAPTTIALVASTPYSVAGLKEQLKAVRTLGQQTVMVGAATQQIPSAFVTAPIQTQLQQAFSNDRQITLNPAVSVTAGEGIINISIPAKISVSDWFDGTLSMTAQIDIGGTTSVQVSAPTVNFQADWSMLSNILSLGNTATAGSAMTQLGQVLFQHIVNAEIVAAIQSALNDQVTQFANSQQQQDPQHRTFSLYSLTFDENFLTITVTPSAA